MSHSYRPNCLPLRLISACAPSCPYKSRDYEQTRPQLFGGIPLSGGVALDSWILDIGDGMQFNAFHINTSKTDKFN